MTVRPQPREVKQLVVRVFLNLGAASPSLFRLDERVLTHGNASAVHTYRADGLRAVWAVEDGNVKFYDAVGRLVRIVNLLTERTPQLMVA